LARLPFGNETIDAGGSARDGGGLRRRRRANAAEAVSLIDSYDNPFLKDRNRRNHSRRRTRLRAWADPGGVAPVYDCVVLDVSEGGASLMSVTGAELPDRFELQLDTHSKIGQAEVAWRKGAAVGVKLDKPK
jgi:hypothetical protein